MNSTLTAVTNRGRQDKDSDQMAWTCVPKDARDKFAGAKVVKVVEPAPKKY